MDVFDGEPYVGLVPRRWVRPFALVAVIVLATYSPARTWLIDQAERHARHEIQRMIDQLVDHSEPTVTRDPLPVPSRTLHVKER